MATEIPGIDTDAGDQQIPTGLEASSELVFLSEPISPTAEPEPAMEVTGSEASSADSPSAEPSRLLGISSADDAPLGLERHYPVQEASPPEASTPEPYTAQSASVEPPSAEVPAAEAPARASGSEGPRAEELGVPAGDSAADGLTSVIPEAVNPLDWSGSSSRRCRRRAGCANRAGARTVRDRQRIRVRTLTTAACPNPPPRRRPRAAASTR